MDTAALSPPSHDGPAMHPKFEDASVKQTAPANALTPPTSEDMNNKAEDSGSELSDIEMDDEDTEEITPDHYYDGGRIPVFKPTMEQFRSFKKYVEKIDKYGMKSGIVKVVPPPEWRESLPALDDLVKSIKIKNPIMQEFMGSHGTYTQANIEKQRSYNLPEWQSLTEEPQNQPPAKRGERRRNQGKVVRGGGGLRGRATAGASSETAAPGPKRKPGRPRRNPLPKVDVKDDDDATQTVVPPTPTSPEADVAEESVETKVEPTPTKAAPKAAKKPRGRPPKGGEQKSVSSRRMNNRTEDVGIIDEAAFRDFDYRMDHLDEFTAERCKELETAYWKSLTFAQPMYAADMPGSLFTESTTSWNVAKLENLLDVLGTKVPGVNTAYLYLGMWKATFAWHLEDVDLYSINYIHFGAPKQWYSISQEDARRFEAAMRDVWPNDSKNCDQFLRHKTYLISPTLLEQKYNIKVNKLVHHEGEFVITYPYGYHSGYNLGYNCAESVNFAQESWLDYGRIARKCECEADSVWVDTAEIERKLRGEPTPEYYEETDDDEEDEAGEAGDLPTPPASVAGKPKGATRKRKRDVKEKDANKNKKKRIRIRIRTATREPCVLCPNDAPHEQLLPTDNGKKAHLSCALYTPETWLGIENGIETVFGVSGIDRARLDLKCNYCRSKRGACFQCAAKKCTRAFHATCAAAAGVQIDAGPVPTFGEDGTEYYEEGYDFRCKVHRAKRTKNTDVDSLENSKLIINTARSLKPKDVVQVQYLGGDVFGGVVVENRPSELSLLVDVLPEGDRIELDWKYITVLDPAYSQRPKPSAIAVPMPEGMNKKSVSIENRQDGIPNVDDTFHDNDAYKWSEFISLDIPPRGYPTSIIKNNDQVKVNFDKPDTVYYYLPRKSTESKSKFTDDPNSKKSVPSAEFLDRIGPAQQRPLQRIRLSSLAATHPHKAVLAPMDKETQPHAYKPKSATNWESIDQQSLAQQRSFTQDATRRASFAGMHGPGNTLPPLRQQTSDPSRQQNSSHFPEHAYYSSKTLPAAFPGEYSNYREHVRQTSGQDWTIDPSSQRPSVGNSAPIANLLNSLPSPSESQTRVEKASAAVKLEPAPIFKAVFKSEQEGSRTSNSVGAHPGYENTARDFSAASADIARRTSGDWTPPSQLYHARAYDTSRFPTYDTPPPTSRPQAVHQSMQDFQQQISQQSQQPSITNRYGAQERLLKEMQQRHQPNLPSMNSTGYSTYGMPQYNNNNNTHHQSPKAPTPSPLSTANTPYMRASSPSALDCINWSMPNGQRMSISAIMQGSLNGQLPQPKPTYGTGNETWRYT